MSYRRFTTFGILLVVILTTLSSCSLYRLGLRYLDWVVVREASSIFNLDAKQKDDLKKLILREMPWLRKTAAPQIVTIIAKLEEKAPAESSLSEDHVKEFFDGLKRIRIELVSRTSKDLATIALTLSDKQLDHAATEFKKKNEKWTDLLSKSDSALRKKRQDKIIDSLETWYGTLADEQENEACQIFDCDRAGTERQLKWSELTQGHLLQTFRTVKTQAQLANEMARWAQDGLLPSSSVQASRDSYQEMARKLTAIDKIMTVKQRQKSRMKLAEIKSDLVWFSQQNI